MYLATNTGDVSGNKYWRCIWQQILAMYLATNTGDVSGNKYWRCIWQQILAMYLATNTGDVSGNKYWRCIWQQILAVYLATNNGDVSRRGKATIVSLYNFLHLKFNIYYIWARIVQFRASKFLVFTSPRASTFIK